MLHTYFTSACGRTNGRLSYGVLWPITRVNYSAEIFCSEINPSFGFGTYATRNCTGNNVWGRVDTSQCTIRPTRQSNIVVYSSFITVPSSESDMPSSPEIEQVSYTWLLPSNYYTLYLKLQKLYNNSQSVRGDLQILSNRFEEDLVSKKRAEPRVLVPIVYTAQLLDDTNSVEQVTQDIQNAVSSGEIIGFSAVGMVGSSIMFFIIC